MSDYPERDDQTEAETLDETHLVEDGSEIANFDDIADVRDVTTAIGDSDDEAMEDWAADWSEGETDIADPDDEASPLTRLEDRPENEASVAATSRGEDQVIDDPASRPVDLEPGD